MVLISSEWFWVVLIGTPGRQKSTANRCRGCNGHHVVRFLDKGDTNLTSNLLWLARICWSTEVVEAATATHDLDAARVVLSNTKLWDFPGDKVTYKHTQHTTSEARYILFFFAMVLVINVSCRAEIVHWVAESKRPFAIVNYLDSNHSWRLDGMLTRYLLLTLYPMMLKPFSWRFVSPLLVCYKYQFQYSTKK